VLSEDELLCPLCGETILAQDAALHYATQPGCPLNPRTSHWR
jgi:hypothetical protein